MTYNYRLAFGMLGKNGSLTMVAVDLGVVFFIMILCLSMYPSLFFPPNVTLRLPAHSNWRVYCRTVRMRGAR